MTEKKIHVSVKHIRMFKYLFRSDVFLKRTLTIMETALILIDVAFASARNLMKYNLWEQFACDAYPAYFLLGLQLRIVQSSRESIQALIHTNSRDYLSVSILIPGILLTSVLTLRHHS